MSRAPHTVVFWMLIAACAFSVQPVHAQTLSAAPTFDCSRARTALLRILCNDQYGANADWDLNAARWAYLYSLPEPKREAFDRAHDNWFQALGPACGIQPQQFFWWPQERDCVLNAFHKRATFYRSQLRGDALDEAKLSPEQRAEIQMGLKKLGFNLESDGEFGPRTREAITRFQQQYGQQPTGFLAGDDRFRVAVAATNNPYFPLNAHGEEGNINIPAKNTRGTAIQMESRGNGLFTVPVLINNILPLDFMVDSGASDVSIPLDVMLTLMRTGTVSEADYLGEEDYVLADGSTSKSMRFRIKSLKIGGKVVENVTASTAPVKASIPLLGQSFLRQFKSWSIDNQRQVLVLE
jgi:clan AA aspartic protease (TIGR02281 family)